ncbi:MAG: hypothetical protein WCK65_15780 [Rhodospirillaceae bacterium]
MNRLFLTVLTTLFLLATSSAFAGDEYNAVPVNDAQYAQCITYSLKKWEGGGDKSPIADQTKVEAFCTCMWNETSDDFKGNLAKFSETPRGAVINKTCEKYSNWGD